MKFSAKSRLYSVVFFDVTGQQTAVDLEISRL
jgi:hypothetical protein